MAKEQKVALHKTCGHEITKTDEGWHCDTCNVSVHKTAEKLFVNVVPQSEVEAARRTTWCIRTGKQKGFTDEEGNYHSTEADPFARCKQIQQQAPCR